MRVRSFVSKSVAISLSVILVASLECTPAGQQLIPNNPPGQSADTAPTTGTQSDATKQPRLPVVWMPLPGAPGSVSPDHETVGEPWTGEMGITETVEQIMRRDAENRASQQSPQVSGDYEPHYPDRTGLPQNPESPAVSQWPPAPHGDTPNIPDQAANPPANDPSSPSNGRNPTPNNPQPLGTNFQGGAISDTPGFIPPDSMGCIGPTQFVVHVNGLIRTFNKSTGVADGALNTTPDTFFASVKGCTGFCTSDPQVRFDRLSNRWYVTIITTVVPNRVLLAVSSGPTIVNSSSFTFFQFQQDLVGTTPNSDTGGFADYPSLGVDANALYIAANMFNSSGTAFLGTSGFVIRKSSVMSGGPIVVTAFRQLATSSGAGPYAPRGVDNDDPAATEGYFIGADNATFGTLMIRRVSNPGGTPTISGNITLTVPTTVFPISGTPAMGSSSPLSALDDRLFAAQMRRNTLTSVSTLWTAHNIQVNTGGTASNSGGRQGSRWYEIQNMTGTPSLRQSGTLFDSAASNPNSFWIPTCAMSGQGHMALACSVAGTTRRAEVATAGRLSSDTLGTIQSPTTIITSATNYNVEGGSRQRWGDYSYVSVDPTDNMTMWSAQMWCNATNSWGIRVTRLIAPPPAAPASCSPSSVTPGFNFNVTVTGTSSSGSGFYDPPNLPVGGATVNHIGASVSGTGVTVNSVIFTDPTHVTLNITVAAGATSGARNVTITNPDGQSATGTGILTVGGACAPITVSPSSLPNGTVGVSYNQTITASGGTSPYTFAVTGGSLPNGLTLATNGSLTGSPTTAGLFTFTITATDASANACTGSQTYTNVRICPVVSVSPATLPDGVVGSAYGQTVFGTGGATPYTFAVTSGSLPPPLTLNSGSGLISGTPNTAGTFNFTVTATDANGCAGGLPYSVRICPAISLSPTSLPNGAVNAAYSQNLTATGGAAPYTFVVASGNFPPGLTLDPSGLLSGTPTTAGLFSFTIRATDNNGCSGTRIYTGVRICPEIAISPTTLPNGSPGSPYSQMLTASGGTGPYTFAVTSGSLPGGLSLSSGGLISGTPASAGNSNFTVTATDTATGVCTGSQMYSLTIGSACSLLGDLNGDSNRDGQDIAHFVNCLLLGSSPGGNCSCGDMNGSGTVTTADVAPFVAALL